MNKRLLVLHTFLLASILNLPKDLFSQGVAIGSATPDASAVLDITATNKGLLIPRMNLTSINAINNPAKGLLIYDSIANQLMANIGTAAAPNWQPIASGNGNAWNLTGNSGINPANQFIGTTDNQPLRFRANNIQAGELHPATGNIFWGLRAGQANTNGISNIAIGTNALRLNTNGTNLVALGDSALSNNSEGDFNSAVGAKALFSNTTGNENTGVGHNALASNVSGSSNTAVGISSLVANGSGGENTAIGSLSMVSNATGSFNTATGSQSLAINFSGNFNTAVGVQSLFSNSTGSFNTAIGGNALNANFNASGNTAVGFNAGFIFNLGPDNTIIGANANVSQDGIANATAIGAGARVNASNKVRIGNGAVTVIEGQVPFTTPSDGRFKFNVQEDVKGLDFIMQLRPVTYQFDVKRFDEQWSNASEVIPASYTEATAIRRTGFIAQEVEKAAIVTAYNFSGIVKPKTAQEHYGLNYESFVVPLVKAVQEQQQIIIELKSQNADLQRRVQALEKK
jgi:trimeric autotransporter adhesin